MPKVKTDRTPVEFLTAKQAKAEHARLTAEIARHDKRYYQEDRPTIADASMCGYLYWPEEIGVRWGDYPHIGAWLERIKALPGWVHPYELMPGHPLPAR